MLANEVDRYYVNIVTQEKILLLSIYFFENIYTADIFCYNDDTEITERLTAQMKPSKIYQSDTQSGRANSVYFRMLKIGN